MFSVLGILSGIIACIIGVWKYFGRKARETRERITAAEKLGKDGVDEKDPSKITAGFDRINRT
jgi:hypothetical protein